MEASKVAGELTAQAQRAEEASFNAQHALAREGEQATERLQAAARQEQQRLAAARAREQRRHAEAARFDPEDLDDDVPPVYAPPAHVPPAHVPPAHVPPAYAPPTPQPPPRRGYADALDDDDEPPASWLT